MIKIDVYTEEFKETYWKTVENKVCDRIQKDIVNSSKKFLPGDFWGGKVPTFKRLILAPFEELKKAKRYLDDSKNFHAMRKECFDQTGDALNSVYKELVDAYKRVMNSEKGCWSMRVRIVKNSGLTVCPYCNRDYINYRAEDISGAQLDHFFSKIDYPIFAVCLYNLVPVCGNCNRVKSNQRIEFASPFDETIDWERDIVFYYESYAGCKPRIVIKSENESIQNNIEKMRIEEAYQIHDAEVEELLEKKQIYCQTQRQEFQEVLHKIEVSERHIKLAVFGPEITKETMKTKPLGKMMNDMYKQLRIY